MLEYTNNMVSNFNETILEGLPSRGNHSKITQLLAPDSVLEGDGIATGGSYDNTYVAWWNIESAFPGYWSRYNNLFRYGVPQGYPAADGMSAVEKLILEKKLSTAQPKLWYVGADTATLVYEYGDKLAIYSEKTKISPLHIGKEGNGYRINLPDKTGVLSHLGYEITENGKVIGFTTTSTTLTQPSTKKAMCPATRYAPTTSG